MIENIQAIYKNGVLHPLKPLDLPEDKIVEIKIIKILGDASDVLKNGKESLVKLNADELKQLERY